MMNMRLIIAIVDSDEANAVTQGLAKAGFSSTRLSTTGGFLLAGNVTMLVGVPEEQVQQVIDVIRANSHRRTKTISPTMGHFLSQPVDVTVGGSTIFVVDVERFEKI